MRKKEPKEGMKVFDERFGDGIITYEDFQSGHPNNFEIDFKGKKLLFNYETTQRMLKDN